MAILLACGTAGAFEVDKCDSVAASNVRTAADFIDANLPALVASFTHLNDSQRAEFKKKWAKVIIVCKDDANHCAKDPKVGGYAHGGAGNRIRACYYNMVDFNLKQCDLVSTLSHEMGHANGYPHMAGHNNPTPAIRANDSMYVMGTKALQFCQSKAAAGQFADAQLTGASQRAIGDGCSKDDQCASGKCQQDECTCKADSDCADGASCYKPIGKPSYCASTSKALGTSCQKDSECRSDKCEKDVCVCRTDSDCPTGQACYTPITGQNHCEATSKAVGATCGKDSECRSGKCEKDVCVCRADSDCPAGQACYTPITGQNHCEATSKAVGATCGKDSECKSGKCEKDKCVCDKDSDCPVGKNCKRPIGKSNFCD
jgi:hypothetical protein